jgi:hypothetical protein
METKMTRYPPYLEHKQIPDGDLLTKVKAMMKDGKGPKQMKVDMPNMSLYTLRRYYTKIRRCVWRFL